MAAHPVSSDIGSSLIARRLGGLLTAAVIVRAVVRCVRPARGASVSTSPGAPTPEPARTRRWPTLAWAVVAAGGAAIWTVGDVVGTVGAISAAAAVWFVVPLASAVWTGDLALIDDLVAERRRSLTVLLLCAAGRLIAAGAAVCAGLYVLPLALATYMLAESFAGRLVDGSERQSNLALALLALVAVAWAAYPLAAGFCAARGGRPGGVAGGLARMTRWGGRLVTGTGTRLVRRWKVALFLLWSSVVAAVLVAGIYALVPALARSDAFAGFAAYGVDTDQVAIGAAAGVLVVHDVLAWGRERSTGAASAMATVVAALAVGLLGLGAAETQLTVHDGVWGVPRGVIVGVAFGVAVAAMLDLAQAVAAGAMALGRRRGEEPYFELAAINRVWYSLGHALGEPGRPTMRRARAELRGSLARAFGEWAASDPRYRSVGVAGALCAACSPLALAVNVLAGRPDDGPELFGWFALLVLGIGGVVAWAYLAAIAFARRRHHASRRPARRARECRERPLAPADDGPNARRKAESNDERLAQGPTDAQNV